MRIRALGLMLALACIARPHGALLADLPRADVTVHVSDQESGEPIASAEVDIGFTVGDGHGATAPLSRSGKTDQNGNFNQSERTLPDITASAVKVGYYRSGIHFDLNLASPQAYDPSHVTLPMGLKHIGNPIAMYARHRPKLSLPLVNTPVGYDLIAADWVTPYGKGTTSDMLFIVNRQPTSPTSELMITFSNEGDGIQAVMANPSEGSALRLPRNAPESGYQALLNLDLSAANQTVARNRNYFFRVRTVKRNGKIVGAMYGKIHGEIDFDVINSKTAVVLFTYYLNPDGARNVEFDPNKNLFTDLPVIERVRDP
jgi:5-hydroxyisourate hydrolase-like protein (transthyretin family)